MPKGIVVRDLSDDHEQVKSNCRRISHRRRQNCHGMTSCYHSRVDMYKFLRCRRRTCYTESFSTLFLSSGDGVHPIPILQVSHLPRHRPHQRVPTFLHARLRQQRQIGRTQRPTRRRRKQRLLASSFLFGSAEYCE